MKTKKTPLIFEQLEERIFLDANPLIIIDPGIDPAGGEDLDLGDVVLQSAAEAAASPEEIDGSSAETVQPNDEVEGADPDGGEAPASVPGEAAEPAVLADVDADASAPVATEVEVVDPLINEDFTFTFSFENELADTGYGPYVDVYFDTSGEDGDYGTVDNPLPAGPPDSDVYDGVRFVSATYEGTDLTFVEQRFDDTGVLDHPFAKTDTGDPVQITGAEGDTYVSIILPFGSYTPDQPAAPIDITAHMSNLAEVEKTFAVTTSSGFMFGYDSLDNPISDPSIGNQAESQTDYLAEVIRFNKTNTAVENEVPTGPNYERSYEIEVDIANEMTVENVVIHETLPDDIEYIPGSVSGNYVQNVVHIGNNLLITLGDITGQEGVDTTVSFDFYVDDILTLCDNSELIENDMHITADWTPFDDRDPFVHLNIDAEVDDDGNISTTPDVDDILEAQPITIQKGAANENGGAYTPGDIVVYTLNFQVSDYHALGNIEITDTMPDGISFYVDASHQPSFTIGDQYGTYSDVDFSVGNGGEVELTPLAGDDTQIDIHVSDALIRAGADAGVTEDGILEGGRTNLTTGGAATGTITYYGIIDDRYTSPDVPVYQGDVLTNSVVISADRFTYPGLDEANNVPGVLDPSAALCSIENADNSSGEVSIPVGSIDKTIYALNGDVLDTNDPVIVKPGDEVTYRLTYILPTADYANLVFADYLPLPIYDADDPDNDGTIDTWATEFTADDIDADIPAVGVAKFGPSETLYTYSSGLLAPDLTTIGDDNAMIFDWDAYWDTDHIGQTVDILFTVSVSTDPFTDGLFLTNMVQGTETGNSGDHVTTDIVQVILSEPELEITKGVIQVSDYGDTDAAFIGDVGPTTFTDPGITGFRPDDPITETGIDPASGTPIDADLTGIDGGDLVSFAITVENVGHYQAFDVLIADTIPDGFAIPTAGEGLNLFVSDGAGTEFTTIGDLFGAGLEIVEELSPNVDSSDVQTENILLITYDLVALASVQPLQTMVNTATLVNYTNIEDGENFIPDGLEDDALVDVTELSLAKVLDGTEIGNDDTGSGADNGINQKYEAVIGERIYYKAYITLPEGTTADVEYTDILEDGLELVSIDSIEVLDQNDDDRDGVVSSDAWGGLDFTSFSPLLDASDARLTYAPGDESSFTLDLGTLTNLDTDNLTDEIIVISYTAMATNDSDSVHKQTRVNEATVSYQTLPPPADPADDPVQVPAETDKAIADPVTIIEPELTVVKTATVNGVQSGPEANWDNQNDPDTVPGDQGDEVFYTILIKHTDQSGATAFDVELEDILPLEVTNLSLVSATHSSLGNIAGTAIFLDRRTLSTSNGGTDTPFDLADGETVTITVSGTLLDVVIGGIDIRNEADIEWTSYDNPLTGDPQPVGSGFVDANDVERTGDPTDPGELNDYSDWDPVLITTDPVTTKYLVNTEITNEADASVDTNFKLANPDDTDGVNSGREAVIGELAFYRIEIEIPEAQYFDVSIDDFLDPGLALVSIDSITRTNTDLIIQNEALVTRDWITTPYDDPDDATDPLNGVPPSDRADYIDYDYGTNELYINFGNISNQNDSDELEYIVIDYTVMVTDVDANSGEGPGSQGTRLTNDAQMEVRDTIGGDRTVLAIASADTIEVIEPDLQVAKDVQVYTTYDFDNPGGNVINNPENVGDAGDTVVYTITIDHSDQTEIDAFDIVVEDTFDSLLSELTVESAVITNANDSTADVAGEFSFSGNDLVTEADGGVDLLYGSQLVLTISGTIVQTVYPDDTIGNHVDISWTSIDGERSDYSNFVDPTEDQERGPDDYIAEADAPEVTVPDPVFSKRLVETDVTEPEADGNGALDATIGEILTYELTLSLPEGQMDNVSVFDQLTAGLDFEDISGSVVTADIYLSSGSVVSASSGPIATITGTAGGDTATGRSVTFDFGTLTVAGDNTGNFDEPVLDAIQGDDQIIIEYRVFVMDIDDNDVINGAPSTFDNLAYLEYDNRDTADIRTDEVSGADVTLVEPDLEVTKTVNGQPDEIDLSGADAGDTITYEIEVEHVGRSGSGAYDLYLNDDLPDEFGDTLTVSSVSATGLTLVTTDFQIYETVAGSGDYFLQFAASGPNTSADRTIDLMVDDSFTVILEGELIDTVQPGLIIGNTAEITWTSLPDGHENNIPDDTPPIDTERNERVYEDDDDIDIIIASPTITKGGGGILTIGEQASFVVEITLPEGQIANLVVTDALPDGLVIEDITDVSLDLSSFTGEIPTAPIVSITGDNDIIFDFSDPALPNQPSITVTDNNDPDDNTLRFLITARVENIEENERGDILINSASATYSDAYDETQTIGTPVAGVIIHEPQITTTKLVVDESGDQTVEALGETLTYTARFTNTGNSTAYDVEIFDQMATCTGYVDTLSVTYYDDVNGTTDISGTTYDTYDSTAFTLEFGSTDGTSWDIGQDDYIEVVYTVQVLGAWFCPGPHVNTIDADWRGLGDDTNGVERIYDDTSDRNPGMSQDGIQDTAAAVFYVPQGDAEIGDTVWFDADRDGVQDLGEGGIADVTVTTVVNTGTGQFTASTTTDSSGYYLFSNLQAATYTVSIDTSTLPPDSEPTYDLDSGILNPDNQATVTLENNQDKRYDVDFGYDTDNVGIIGDTVWYDADRDGDQGTGEIGIPSATVLLEGDINGNGNFDYQSVAFTNADGEYLFTNLPFNSVTNDYVDYKVTVIGLPYGFNTQTGDPDDVLDNMGETRLADADGQREDLSMDFGYVGDGQIGDLVWDDVNADGILDPTETGILPGGIAVTLEGDLERDGTWDFTIDTTTSLVNGSYLFDGLPTGDGVDYRVTVDPTTLPGATASSSDWIPSGDPDGGLDHTSLLTLSALTEEDKVDLDQDFGYTRLGSIGDTVWFDIDGNEVQNGSEPGISGVTVTITGDWDLDGIADTDTAVTDSDGYYFFDDLPYGTYTVTVDDTTLPGGMTPTWDLDWPLTPHSASVDLGYNEDKEDVDFGYIGTGEIGDFIWNDLNGDGAQDPGEPGLDGVEVTIAAAPGSQIPNFTQTFATAATATAGQNYLFTSLPAGTYTITVDESTIPLTNFIQSWHPDGRAVKSNESSTTLTTDSLSDYDQDFGYTEVGSIGDYVWFDVNGDGVQDSGEPGLIGVTVTLQGDVDLDGIVDTLTTVTDADGLYLFDDIPAGTHTISIATATLPGGMRPTYDPDGSLDNQTTYLLSSGEDNRDQDFGYTGTGSIGDTIWNDANRNGIQDGAEQGIPGVVVELSGDIDGDGAADFTVDATTDGSGGYLFDGLPAGSYSIVVDVNTVPPQYRQTFDPDGTLDSQTQLTLGAGENNLDQDFGYATPFIPELPGPPVPPVPPVSPETGLPEPGDPMLGYQFSESAADRIVFPVERTNDMQQQPVPITPLFSGRAEPGTTLHLILSDAEGNTLGYETIIADPGGSWIGGFTNTILADGIYEMEVIQTVAAYNNSSQGFYNLRTYFNPAFIGMHYSSTVFDTGAVFSSTAEIILQAMHQSNRSLLDLDWDEFSGYEFFSPSINQSQHKR